MLLNAAITEFKLHAFSLVQTTSGFCKLCRTGSPVYHVVFNHVFSRLFGEKLGTEESGGCSNVMKWAVKVC